MNRKSYVDFVKCIAIFFVLMNHIGMTIPYISTFGGMFYVPVFFVLAGYTYKAKEESYTCFVKKKAKRLLIPYIVANLFFFVFFFIKDDVLNGSVGIRSLLPLLGIGYSRYSLFVPTEQRPNNVYFLTIQNSPTWFLTALFLTYLLFEITVRIASSYKKKQGKYLILGIASGFYLLVGVLLHYACPILLPWSLECISLFTVYMLAGYLVAEKNLVERIWKIKGIFPYLVLAFIIFTTIVGYQFGGTANISLGNFGNYVILGVLNGISASLLMVFLCYGGEKWLPNIFCSIGRNTLYILCYHMFVYMFLITGCNIAFPGILRGKDIPAYMLKIVIIVVTVSVIMTIEAGVTKLKKSAKK